VVLGLGAWFAPLRLALPVGFVVAVAHGLGAGSWLVGEGVRGLLAAVALLVVVERLLAWSWDRLRQGETRSSEFQEGKESDAPRWLGEVKR
jgi:hypothetical protein